MTEAASLLPGSPTERKKKKKKSHSRCLEASGRTCVCARINTLFLLVLTCISKPLTRCSWKRIRSAHTHTHTHTQTQESVLGSVAITSDALIPPPAASLWGPACSTLDVLQPAEREGKKKKKKRLIAGCAERNIGGCSVSFSSFVSNPPPTPRLKVWKVKRG